MGSMGQFTHAGMHVFIAHWAQQDCNANTHMYMVHRVYMRAGLDKAGASSHKVNPRRVALPVGVPHPGPGPLNLTNLKLQHLDYSCWRFQQHHMVMQPMAQGPGMDHGAGPWTQVCEKQL